MSEQRPGHEAKRTPQVFDAGDPQLIVEPVDPTAAGTPTVRPGSGAKGEARGPTAATAATGRGFRPGWGSVLVASSLGLAGLAASVAFARFVSVVLERSDWIGVTGWALLCIALLALIVIALREIVGLIRLGRLAGLRRDAEAAHRSQDTNAEKSIVRRRRRDARRRRASGPGHRPRPWW